jgi:ABC-type transport system substrate-binding protein
MKETRVLIVLATLALVLLTSFPTKVKAFEYSNTSIYFPPGPQTDNVSEAFGPMADHIQIVMYSNEIYEFTDLEQGKLDVTDWPVDCTHYPSWTGLVPSVYNSTIAVVNTGPQYGMFGLDIRMNNETLLYNQVGANVGSSVGPNPAYNDPAYGGNNPQGNPCADIWLRRAIASCVDRKYTAEQIVSGGTLPLLAQAIYSPANDPPYTGWGDPSIDPTKPYPTGLGELCYSQSDGERNCSLGNYFLDNHGYLPIGGDGYRTYGGNHFSIEFVIRSDDTNRKLFGLALLTTLTTTGVNGLSLNVVQRMVSSGGARAYFMDAKAGHLYTAGWGLTSDPDHLYYLYHINNYHHTGTPNNYAYYPGDYQQITVPYNGWQYNYTNIPSLQVPITWGDTSYNLDLSDYGKTWRKFDKVWVNPQNYWSWEMMISTNGGRATLCAHKSEEAIAEEVCGVPVWAPIQYSAFYRNYTGPEAPYTNQPWKGVVDQKGFGVWSTRTFLDMHTANAVFGNGNMTIRWGFRQPTLSLNPIYAGSAWDWCALSQCYDAAAGVDPYVPSQNIGDLVTSWELGTWDASRFGLGTCTNVTFHLRQDALWSDGVPLTASDFVFSWGGHKAPASSSIASLLDATGNPPPYWDGQISDMLSVAAPDPWTVIVYLNVYAYFGLHSMSGWNIVLPEHIWRPFITNPPSGFGPQDAFNVPSVCSGAWKLRSTASVTVGDSLWLDANPLYFRYRRPLDIWTVQEPSTTPGVKSLGQTYWIDTYGTPASYNADVVVDVSIRNDYVYEVLGTADKADLYANTMLAGLKNVTLWKWTQTGYANDTARYAQVATLLTNAPWNSTFGVVDTESIDLGMLTPGFYFIRIDVLINTMELNGVDRSSDNPFNGQTSTYREYIIVTERTDYTGSYWKSYNGPYQPIPDLWTDLKDIARAAKYFGAYPGHPRWNPQADMNGDKIIDMWDIRKLARDFGWRAR